MAFIEPMHRNKPNITYLLTYPSRKFEGRPYLLKKNSIRKALIMVRVGAYFCLGRQKSLRRYFYHILEISGSSILVRQCSVTLTDKILTIFENNCLLSNSISVMDRSSAEIDNTAWSRLMRCCYKIYPRTCLYDALDVNFLLWVLLKGLRMVARALWRSEARRVVPWSETLHEP